MKPIPKLKEIYNRIAADLKSRLGLLLLALKLVTDVLAAVWSGQLWLAYLYLQGIQNNIFADTADPEDQGGTLNRLGQMYLGRQPFPATDGYYTLAVTGIAGGYLRAGLTWKSNDDSRSPGWLYIQDDEFTFTDTTGTVTLRALNAGRDYQLDPGDGLTATEPLIGADQLATVDTMTVQPTAPEPTEDYRQKVLNAMILEPQGGARSDYRIWAADAPGVRTVYPYAKQGDAGTIQVYVEATPEDSTDGKGTPSSALLDMVESVITLDPDETLDIDARGRMPMGKTPEVLAIGLKPVDVTIGNLQSNTSDVRAGISAALIDYLYTVRPFVDGADLLRDRNDNLTTVKLQSVVSDTIGNANTFLSFSMSVDGAPVSSFQFTLGFVPYLRNVNYI